MTRKEYLQEETEKKINDLYQNYVLKQELSEEKKNELGMIGFLYSCGRIEPLDMLVFMSRELSEENYKKWLNEVRFGK